MTLCESFSRELVIEKAMQLLRASEESYSAENLLIALIPEGTSYREAIDFVEANRSHLQRHILLLVAIDSAHYEFTEHWEVRVRGQ